MSIRFVVSKGSKIVYVSEANYGDALAYVRRHANVPVVVNVPLVDRDGIT